jgi:hypothetical protein
MKLSRRDKVVTVVLITIILVLLYIMQCHWRNRLGARGDAQPVGEVEYKYHQVQRKYSDRMQWEEVESKSPIYAYDWVMTKDKSDARITLKNGMKVDMDPDSMVEIDESREGVGLTLRDGTIRADTRNAKGGTITSANGSRIDLNKANAQITSDGNNLSVDVKEGNVMLTSNGKESRVSAGEIGKVSDSGFSKEKVAIALVSPPQGVTLQDSAKPVQFTFERPAGAENCSIALSGAGTKRTIQVSGNTHNEKLDDSSYQWRVGCELKGEHISSAAGAFRVRPHNNFALLSPAPGEVVPSNKAENLVLRWSGSGNVNADLSSTSDFSSLIKSATTSGNSMAVGNLSPGQYFWRVSPKDQPGQAIQSRFTVSDKGEILTEVPTATVKEPAKVKPTDKKDEKIRLTASVDALIYIEPDAPAGSATVSWKPVNPKYTYRLQISPEEAAGGGVITREVKGKSSLKVQLAPGTYSYRVDVRKTGARRSLAATTPKKIEVRKKKLPPPPRVKSVEAQ